MSNDAKSVGADFAKDLATGVANKAIDKISGCMKLGYWETIFRFLRRMY